MGTLRVREHQRLSDVANVRQWDALTARPPASLSGSRAWLTAAFKTAHPEAKPYLLAVEDRGVLVALLTLSVHDLATGPTLRFAGAPHNDLTDLMVLRGHEAAAGEVVINALRSLSERGWSVHLDDLDPGGALVAADRDSHAMALVSGTPAPVIDLQGEWRFVASSRRRQQWRRRLRRLREHNRVEFGRIEGNDVMCELPKFARLREARRRATGRPRDQPPHAFIEDAVRRLAPSGRCVLSRMMINDRPAAMDLYLVDAGVAMMWLRALDPSWRRFPCGHLLLRETAECFAADGYRALDLGRGDEPYKFVFGGDRRVLLAARM